ncbi:mechanosensitive ion channel family protein [Alloyangia pacifica]|uniref:mechanosensitive ion channel family protein n=1 Tax=Alloyangia pacifica TaxID=311180 RepID=UPI001CD24407|nr:mechanosensitive ion channel family protein [Alloyangia pacifica]MCA0998717.1 mechanosensitive ion channel family protein [Alloyangia pacifica]
MPRDILRLLSILLLSLTACIAIPAIAQETADAPPEAAAEEPPSPAEQVIEGAEERGRQAAISRPEVLSAAGAADAPLEPESDAALLTALANPSIPSDELALRTLPLTAAELSQLAQAWEGIAKGMTKAVVQEQMAINAREANGEEVPRERLTQLTEVRNDAFENLSTVVAALEAKGGDEAEVAGYRAYRAAIHVDETQRADWRTLLSQAANWATDEDGGVQLALRVAVIVGSLLGLLILARAVRGVARRALSRVPDLSKLLQAFIVMVIYWLTIAFGLMIVLSALGIDVTPLFALVGGASFIIAFAMQDTLGNLAAGLMIMINRPFDEGDYVTVAGTGGTVQSVSIVSTTVLTPDNQVIVIPNSKVWGDVITNVTASATRRVDLTFGIGYGDSIEKAQEVLEKVVAEHPLILDDPAPVVRVNALGASSVDFICRPWVNVEDYWTVYWDLTRQVKEAFDREGISIPFPQTDMHVHMAKPGALPFTEEATKTAPPEEGTPYHAREDRVTSFRRGDEGYDEDSDNT